MSDNPGPPPRCGALKRPAASSTKARTAILALVFFVFPLISCTFDPARRSYEEAESAFAEGDYEGALRLYSGVYKGYASSPYGRKSGLKAGVIYGRHLNEAEKAAGAFIDLIAAYPESMEAAEAFKELALVYSASGEHRRAIEVYSRLAVAHPSEAAAAQYLTALEYLEMGDFRQARTEFKELLELFEHPGLAPSIRFKIAETHYMEGNLKDAIAAFDFVIRTYPENEAAIESLFGKARVLQEEGRLREAVAILKGLKGRYGNEEALKTRMASLERMIRETEGIRTAKVKRKWKKRG